MKGLPYTKLVTIFLLLLFSSCTPTQSPPAATPGAEEVETEESAVVEPDVVSFWVGEGDTDEIFRKHVEAYNASQDRVNVRLELIPSGEQGTGMQDKMGIALASGDPPDVAYMSLSVLGQAGRVDTPLVVDLAPYTTEEIQEDFGQLLDTYLFRGKLYGYPANVRIGFAPFIGNKQMLEDAGIDYKAIQQEGWTWDQFVDILTRLKASDADGGGTIWPLVVEGSQWHLGMMFSNFARTNCIGANHSANPMFGNQFNYGGPKMVESVQFVHDLIYEHEVIPREALGMNVDQMFQMFINKEAAFYMTEPGLVDPIQAHNRQIEEGELQGDIVDVESVLLPFPHNPPCRPTADTRPSGVMVFRQDAYQGDEHTQNAVEFAQYLVSTEAMVERYQAVGLAPASASAIEALPELENDEYVQGFYAILDLAATPNPPNHPNWFHLYWDIIYPRSQAALTNAMTPQEAVDEWTEVSEAEMEQWIEDNPDQVPLFADVPPVPEWPGPLFECDRGIPQNYDGCQ